jgi:hypothetical protein
MIRMLRVLLDELESAFGDSVPVRNNAIRTSLYEAVDRGLVRQEAGYHVPHNLLLACENVSAEMNNAVVEALSKFIRRARRSAAATGLDTPARRRRAFRNSLVVSSNGFWDVEDFFA